MNFFLAQLIKKIHREINMTQVVNERKCHCCYHQSYCSFFSSMLLVHRLQLMSIASDMRWLPDSQCGEQSYPKMLYSILHNLGFHSVCIIITFGVCLQVPERPIPKGSLQLDPGSYCAEENLASMQRLHIKNLPAPLSVLTRALADVWTPMEPATEQGSLSTWGFGKPRDYPNS